jgi:hypothetical protein
MIVPIDGLPRTRALWAIAALAVAVIVGWPTSAQASPELRDDVTCDVVPARPQPVEAGGQPGEGERVGPYEIDVRVAPDGTAHVEERLTLDVGASPERAGVTLQLVLRERCAEGWERVHPLSGLTVGSSTGAPVDVVVEEAGDVTLVHVGRGGPAVAGVHRYEIAYQVGSVPSTSQNHQSMEWWAVGEGWDVPITDLTLRVEAPAESLGFPACWAGKTEERRRCTDVRVDGTTMIVTQSSLAAGEPLMVSIALPEDTFAAAQLVERSSGSFPDLGSIDRRTVGIALFGVAGAAALLLVVRGRPWRGKASGSGPAGGSSGGVS